MKEDNFLECVLPEFDIKINYPATWTKIDNKTDIAPGSDHSVAALFFAPREVVDTSYFESVGISMLKLVTPGNIPLKEAASGHPDYMKITLDQLVEENLEKLKSTHSDFVLIQPPVPTTIAAESIPSRHIIYMESGIKTLAVCFVIEKELDNEGSKPYWCIIGYRARPEKYLDHLSTVEQMIASFEFLS